MIFWSSGFAGPSKHPARTASGNLAEGLCSYPIYSAGPPRSAAPRTATVATDPSIKSDGWRAPAGQRAPP